MYQRVLLVDATIGFFKTKKYGFDRYFRPVDLGIHLAEKYRSLNFGVAVEQRDRLHRPAAEIL